MKTKLLFEPGSFSSWTNEMQRLARFALRPLLWSLAKPLLQISQMQFWILSKVSRLDYPRSWFVPILLPYFILPSN